MENISHHHHEHHVHIVVNTRQKRWEHKEISYEQVVRLAFENPSNDEKTVYTVTYRRGAHNAHGTLTKGQHVEVREEMIFDVVRTDKS
jgi:hypothetical protein